MLRLTGVALVPGTRGIDLVLGATESASVKIVDKPDTRAFEAQYFLESSLGVKSVQQLAGRHWFSWIFSYSSMRPILQKF